MPTNDADEGSMAVHIEGSFVAVLNSRVVFLCGVMCYIHVIVIVNVVNVCCVC